MESVSRRFNGLTAVDDVSFALGSGTILGLIGPSGSGKTTVVRMLTGTLEPTAGRITVMGEEPRHFTRRAREEIAYMPQLFSLYHDLTAAENVGFVAALFGIFPWQRRRLIRRALEVVGLWDARGRLARDLSGGMQRRLELACALVHDPQVLFLDEPTAGIDPILRADIWDELHRLRDAGRTLLVTTQYVGEAEYCDHVALLSDGELIAFAEPDRLRRDVFGGELLHIVAAAPVDAQVLATVDGLTSVRQVGPQELEAVADDAGTAVPRIVDAMRAFSIGVSSVEPRQPNFDEVFTELVERRRGEREVAS